MTEFCPMCRTPRRPGVAFCDKCGYRFQDRHCPRCNNIIDSESSFCRQCGYKLTDTVSAGDNHISPAQTAGPAVPPWQAASFGTMMNSMPQQQNHAPVFDNTSPSGFYDIPPSNPAGMPRHVQKKSGGAFKVILIVVIAAAVLAGGFFLSRPLWDKSVQDAVANVPASNVPVTIPQKKEPAPPVVTYDSPSVIRPAIYQSTDYLVNLKGSSEEDKEVMLTVEIPGFTEKYEQKLTLTPQVTTLKIRPPMIEGVLGTLNIQREAQLRVSVQDVATQKYIIQDTKPVQLLSKNDMKWESDDGSETYYENICAWVTPESPKIKELLRNSVDQLSIWTEGQLSAIVGYQDVGLSAEDTTYYQVAAMFETMRSYYNVRYTATPISTSGSEAQQRIALPDEVLDQKSGLCIETAVTLASAIEATGMHPMILILPGHAQVAVETWQNSGEYYLVETTALTEPDWNNIIYYYDQDQWSQYLADNQVTVVDVELARKDGIKPMQ